MPKFKELMNETRNNIKKAESLLFEMNTDYKLIEEKFLLGKESSAETIFQFLLKGYEKEKLRVGAILFSLFQIGEAMKHLKSVKQLSEPNKIKFSHVYVKTKGKFSGFLGKLRNSFNKIKNVQTLLSKDKGEIGKMDDGAIDKEKILDETKSLVKETAKKVRDDNTSSCDAELKASFKKLEILIKQVASIEGELVTLSEKELRFHESEFKRLEEESKQGKIKDEQKIILSTMEELKRVKTSHFKDKDKEKEKVNLLEILEDFLDKLGVKNSHREKDIESIFHLLESLEQSMQDEKFTPEILPQIIEEAKEGLLVFTGKTDMAIPTGFISKSGKELCINIYDSKIDTQSKERGEFFSSLRDEIGHKLVYELELDRVIETSFPKETQYFPSRKPIGILIPNLKDIERLITDLSTIQDFDANYKVGSSPHTPELFILALGAYVPCILFFKIQDTNALHKQLVEAYTKKETIIEKKPIWVYEFSFFNSIINICNIMKDPPLLVQKLFMDSDSPSFEELRVMSGRLQHRFTTKKTIKEVNAKTYVDFYDSKMEYEVFKDKKPEEIGGKAIILEDKGTDQEIIAHFIQDKKAHPSLRPKIAIAESDKKPLFAEIEKKTIGTSTQKILKQIFKEAAQEHMSMEKTSTDNIDPLPFNYTSWRKEITGACQKTLEFEVGKFEFVKSSATSIKAPTP